MDLQLLTARQDLYVLTCEASGGGSMAYTYMWLRNGSEVSDQSSSTYSFSPLLVVHSVQYSCRVSLGSLNVTSEAVKIIVGGELGIISRFFSMNSSCTKLYYHNELRVTCTPEILKHRKSVSHQLLHFNYHI